MASSLSFNPKSKLGFSASSSSTEIEGLNIAEDGSQEASLRCNSEKLDVLRLQETELQAVLTEYSLQRNEGNPTTSSDEKVTDVFMPFSEAREVLLSTSEELKGAYISKDGTWFLISGMPFTQLKAI
ncbi:hypothetical protein C5167_027704 [Papaver somniferum]|nr:hypothetical protein C5167_027704 [Papaver somniferum]